MVREWTEEWLRDCQQDKIVSIHELSRLHHKLSCMYIVRVASGCTHEDISLDDLDNISVLLDENNDLEL